MIFAFDNTDAGKSKSKSKSNGKGSSDAAVVKQEKQSELNSVLLSKSYKLPLVWIDMEMTGKHRKKGYL